MDKLSKILHWICDTSLLINNWRNSKRFYIEEKKLIWPHDNAKPHSS